LVWCGVRTQPYVLKGDPFSRKHEEREKKKSLQGEIELTPYQEGGCGTCDREKEAPLRGLEKKGEDRSCSGKTVARFEGKGKGIASFLIAEREGDAKRSPERRRKERRMRKRERGRKKIPRDLRREMRSLTI